MTSLETQLNHLYGQMLYYKGKCEAYESYLRKQGVIEETKIIRLKDMYETDK